MKKISKIVLTSMICSPLLFTTTYAADNEISISPPPISADSISSSGGSVSNFGISVLSYSSDDFDLSGFGLNFGKKSKSASGFIFEPTFGLMSMSGEDSGGNVEMTMTSLDANLMLGQKMGVLTLFAGPTIQRSLMSMEMDMYVTNGYYGYYTTTYIDTTTTTTGLSYGIQVDLPVSFGLITPFYVIKSLSSESENDDSGATTEYDMDISQLGFDIYFSSLGTSLSAMAQSDDNGDMVYFSYNWKF